MSITPTPKTPDVADAAATTERVLNVMDEPSENELAVAPSP